MSISKTLRGFQEQLPQRLASMVSDSLTLDAILSEEIHFVESPPKAGFTTIVNSLRASSLARHEKESAPNIIIAEGTREHFEPSDDPFWQWARWMWKTLDFAITQQTEDQKESLKYKSPLERKVVQLPRIESLYAAPLAALAIAAPIVANVASSFSVKVADNKTSQQDIVNREINKWQLELIKKNIVVIVCVDIHKWKAGDKAAKDLRADWETLKRFLKYVSRPVTRASGLRRKTETLQSPVKFLIHDSNLRVEPEPKVFVINPLGSDQLTRHLGELGLDLAEVKRWFKIETDFYDLFNYSLGYPAYVVNILEQCAVTSDDSISHSSFTSAVQNHASEIITGYKNYFALFNADRNPDRAFVNPYHLTEFFGQLYYPMVLDPERKDGRSEDGRQNPYSLELSLRDKGATDIHELTQVFLRQAIEIGWFRLSDSSDEFPNDWTSTPSSAPTKGKWVWMNPAYTDALGAVIELPKLPTSTSSIQAVSESQKNYFVQPLFSPIVPGKVRIRTVISHNLGYEFPSWLLESIKLTGMFDPKRAIREDPALKKITKEFVWDKINVTSETLVLHKPLTKHHPFPLVRSEWEVVQPQLGTLSSTTYKERIKELFERNPRRFVSIVHLKRESVGGLDPGRIIRDELQEMNIITPSKDHPNRAERQRLWALALADTSSYGLRFKDFLEELKRYVTAQEYEKLLRYGTGMYIYVPKS